jgi:uncharacterized phage protein (TIGR02218 family)
LRSTGAPLATHLAGTAHTRCRMLLFILRDGTKIGITDHNEDIDFTLAEDGDETTYLSDTGFRISDVAQPIGFEAGNYEVTGPVADVVTLAALLGGRWKTAATYLFEINWKAPTSALDLMKGSVTVVGINGGQFRFEVRDDRHRFNETLGRLITNQCPRKHDQCCVNIAPETETTVDSVTDSLTLTVDAAITSENFVYGRLWFTTGVNAGNDPIEIYAVSGSTITLFSEMVALPSPGDEVTLKEGCDGSRAMCRDRFGNVIEHRGFPEIPGSDQILRAPIPGQGDQ